MKCVNAIILQIAVGLISLSSAVDRPESYIRRYETFENRELQALDSQECYSQLSLCQSIIGPTELPYSQWADMLSRMDAANVTLAVDLRRFVDSLAVTNFSDFGSLFVGAGKESSSLALRELILNVKNMSTALQEDEIKEDGINWFVDFIIKKINTIGFIFHHDFSPITNIISIVAFLFTFAVALVGAVPLGPVAIFGVVFVNLRKLIEVISKTIGIFSRDSALRTTEEAACASELVQCSVDKMVLNVMPTLVGGVFLAESLASSSAEP
jgi:hypothetical protein